MSGSGNNSFIKQNTDNSFNSEDIDIFQFLKIFVRNKFLILNVIFVFLVLGVLYALNLKKIWEGNFQIVLEEKNNKTNLSSLNLGVASILSGNLKEARSSLETELGILKSPLVLTDAFEFVKLKKNPNKNGTGSNLNFLGWRNGSLTINLEDKTTILNLSYRDENKELILPVLEKISRDYQKYSGRKRMREIQLGKKYFKNQIDQFKLQSAKSTKNLQTFSSKYDLTAVNIGGPNQDQIITNIEETRIKSGNLIRNYKLKLEQIDNVSGDEAFVLISTTIYQNEGSPIINQIRKLNTELALKNQAYLPNDLAITDLVKQKKNYQAVLKKQAKVYLKSLIKNEEAKLGSTVRPEGVVFNYKQILKEAIKDEKTLKSLELNYNNLLLEESRINDPWELITSPTLSPYPVGPSRKLVVYAWGIFGFLAGTIIAFIKERIKGVIYSPSEIEVLLGKPNLLKIDFIEKDQVEEDLDLIFRSKTFENNKNIFILKVGEINQLIENKITENIKISRSGDITFKNSIKQADKNSKILLLFNLGKIKRKQLLICKQKIELLGLFFMGSIIIEDKSSQKKI